MIDVGDYVSCNIILVLNLTRQLDYRLIKTTSVVLTTKPETEAFFAIGARVTITCLSNVEIVGDMTWYRKKLPNNAVMEAEDGVLELKTVRIV